MDVKELIGVTLGNCSLERIIGRGGMGAVFLAQQARPIRIVAVKALLPPQGTDPADQRIFLERFRREADTVAKLEHKNILPVYESAESLVNGQEIAYLVMPYIRGGTLRERIDEMNREGKHFDLRLVADYIDQVADALDYAHTLGVVHRDVKPANLLFHQDGRLLLSDFGIARLSAMPALTNAGIFLGTAEYASPEQANAGNLDARSDIYSLGIILYELLTGHVPFTAPNPFAILAKHLKEPVPSIRNARPDLSPSIEFVVKKALAKNPADRYQSAHEMAADLRAAISPISAIPADSAAIAASAAPGMLRLGGDARNSDSTVADHPWLPPVAHVAQGDSPPAPALATPAVGVASPIPPTSPAVPIGPAGGAVPTPGQPGQWYWPSQGAQQQQGAYATPVQQVAGNGAASANPALTRQWKRRWYYYGTILVAVLAQLPVLGLLLAANVPGSASPAILGLLLGTCVNLLALAAIGFTGVTRDRPIRKYVYRCLAVALAAPLVSGFFVNFGAGPHAHSVYFPLIAYLVLLASNIFALRQLGGVDIAPEQVRSATILWRSVLIGALTGLLPLTMILVLTLTTSAASPSGVPPLLHVFGVLLIALIGAPTPGAVLAVWLSQKMSASTFFRSSALAGMLMFAAAFVLSALWSLLTAGHLLFLAQFKLSGLAFLVGLLTLSLIGALRGMLDVHVYWRLTHRPA